MTRVSAAADLEWYFGAGSESYDGDCGLRSSLGSQIEVLAQSVGPKGERLPLAPPTVDASSVEDAVLERLSSATRATVIEYRLRQLSDAQVLVLRLHFGARTGDDDAAAVLVPSARRLVLSLYREEARRAIQRARKARKDGDPQQAETALRDLRRARAEGRVLARRFPLPSEVLSVAFRQASPKLQLEILSEAAQLVAAAIQAYESTRGLKRSPVPLHDPRRWKAA